MGPWRIGHRKYLVIKRLWVRVPSGRKVLGSYKLYCCFWNLKALLCANVRKINDKIGCFFSFNRCCPSVMVKWYICTYESRDRVRSRHKVVFLLKKWQKKFFYKMGSFMGDALLKEKSGMAWRLRRDADKHLKWLNTEWRCSGSSETSRMKSWRHL
jgi:hypothetical protein